MQETVPNEDTGLNLRKLVADVDETTSRQIEPHDVWRALVGGTLCVCDTFTDDARAYLVLQPSRAAPLSARDVDMLGRALCGADQKVIALDSGLAFATVATILKRSLQRLGISAVPSRAPLLVSLLAQSANNPAVTRALKCCSVSVSNQTYQIVSRELGSSRWESLLSPAELDVVLLRAEGRSHAEIAALRNTSLRTIANQVGSAFRRLGLSGRSRLLAGFA